MSDPEHTPAPTDGGHCRHCDCIEGDEPPEWAMPAHSSRFDRSTWEDGGCPACAEAERIDQNICALIALGQTALQYAPDGDERGTRMRAVLNAYEDCRRIARGEPLSPI